MQVDPSASSVKDQAAKKAAGLAKNAVGWIQRVLQDSVQEITDFSALLSASTDTKADVKPQSDSANKASQQAAGISAQEQIALRAKVEVNPLKLNKRPEADPKPQQQAADSSDQPAVKQTDEDAEKEADTQEDSSETPAEASPAETTKAPETAAVELIAAQLQDTQKVAVAEKVETDVSASAAVKADTAPAQASAVPDNVAKDAVDFVQKSALKQQAAEQAAGAQSIAKSEDPSIAAASPAKPTNAPVTIDLDAGKASAAANVQTQATASVSTDTSTSAIALSQTFMTSWSSNFAQGSAGNADAERTGGIEGLSATTRLSNNLPKSASDAAQAGTQAQSAKAADAVSADRTAAGFSLTGNPESGQKTDSSKSSKPLTRSQSSATMEKVDAALKKASEAKDGTVISLRLDPPSLGSVKVDVSLRDGILHARVTADSVQVIQLLRERAPDLQVTLRKLGLDVDKVSVSVNSGDQGTLSNDSEQNRGGSGQQAGNFFPQLAESAAGKESLNLDHWIA